MRHHTLKVLGVRHFSRFSRSGHHTANAEGRLPGPFYDFNLWTKRKRTQVNSGWSFGIFLLSETAAPPAES